MIPPLSTDLSTIHLIINRAVLIAILSLLAGCLLVILSKVLGLSESAVGTFAGVLFGVTGTIGGGLLSMLAKTGSNAQTPVAVPASASPVPSINLQTGDNPSNEQLATARTGQAETGLPAAVSGGDPGGAGSD